MRQNIKKLNQKYTEKDFEREFGTNDACLEWLKNYRFPEGITCPTCKKVTKHHKISRRPCYKCDNCGHELYPLAGTIFHKSSTPLKTWLKAMFYMATTRSGRSAKELQRTTGVTYKTAWRMYKQIRSLLGETEPKLQGIVESDTSYFGGRLDGMGVEHHMENKTPVIGAVEREGDVRAKVVENTKWANVTPFIASNVAKRSVLCTDEGLEFKYIDQVGLNHRTVNHQERYNDGGVHTNTIEGFWSLVKGGISGVYHSVSPKYLQSYINEYSFRYNHRDDQYPMFRQMLKQIR